MGTHREKRNSCKTNILKIDKDCFVDPALQTEYIHAILQVCAKYGIKILWVKSTRSRHGIHFYVKISRALPAHKANRLQYLLGDDAKRVEFNRSRIESGLVEWNKLFERSDAKLTTVYRSYSLRYAGSEVEIQSFRTLSR